MNKKAIISTLFGITLLLGGSFAYLHLTNSEESVSQKIEAEEPDSIDAATSAPIDSSTQDTATSRKPDEETAETLPLEDTGESVTVTELETPTKLAEIPVTTNHFNIENNVDGSYTVTLYAIINNPSQYDEYLVQLAEYKKESIDYLSSAGIDPESSTIVYLPNEAAEL